MTTDFPAGPGRAEPVPAGLVPAGLVPGRRAKASPAQANSTKAPDPFAWLARQDGAGRPVSRPPGSSPTSGYQPEQPVGWQHPSLPRALTEEWETAIRQNAAYAKAAPKGRQQREWREPRQRRMFRFVLRLVWRTGNR